MASGWHQQNQSMAANEKKRVSKKQRKWQRMASSKAA